MKFPYDLVNMRLRSVIPHEIEICAWFPSSLNEALQLEQKKLVSDYDKLKQQEREKDEKLQKLMWVRDFIETLEDWKDYVWVSLSSYSPFLL